MMVMGVIGIITILILGCLIIRDLQNFFEEEPYELSKREKQEYERKFRNFGRKEALKALGSKNIKDCYNKYKDEIP